MDILEIIAGAIVLLAWAVVFVLVCLHAHARDQERRGKQ